MHLGPQFYEWMVPPIHHKVIPNFLHSNVLFVAFADLARALHKFHMVLYIQDLLAKPQLCIPCHHMCRIHDVHLGLRASYAILQILALS